MKRFSQQLNNKAKELKLSAAEKQDLRDRVVSYMEYHPVSQGVPQTRVVANESYRIFNFDVTRAFQLTGSFVLILTLSISYLAEKAIPGDTLYAIKVGVNEELRSTLARGSYEKVVWETERLNRRISEARLLADEGRLTQEVEAQVAVAVKEHSDNARKEIENLKLIDKDEATLASIELTTALDIQTTSLRNRDQVDAAGQSTDLIKDVLEASQAAELTSEDSNLPAYEKLSAKIESETTRAHELLRDVSSVATSEEQLDIKRRLDDIDVKILAAGGLLAENEMAARQQMRDALQQTHRLIIFMTNIDVRASVTVDEIVPVTLTAAEKIAIAQQKIAQAELMQVQIADLLQSTSTPGVDSELLAKITPAIEQSSSSLAQAKAASAIEVIDEPALTTLSDEAYNVLLDILGLLQLTPTPVIVIDEVSTSTPDVSTEADVVTDEEVVSTTTPEVEAVVETAS